MIKLVAVTADVLMVAAAMILAYRLRSALPGQVSGHGPSDHVTVGLLSLPLWVAIFAHYHLYRANSVQARLDEWRRLVHAVAASVGVTALVGYAAELYVARGRLA